jgi:large subunit ribosomal protein L4
MNKQKNRENLVAKVVRAIQASQRHASPKTKKRGEVSGGGKKPWRQKGTGRARAGSNRSPIWRGGGVTFGPTGMENHKIKVNKKEKEIALQAVLEEKKNDIKKLDLPKITKTKEAAAFLKKNEVEGKVLILVSQKKSSPKETAEFVNLKKVFRNIPNVRISEDEKKNVLDVLWAKKIIVLSEKEIKKPQEATAKKKETK